MPKYDYTEDISNIKMFYYMIIRLSLREGKVSESNFEVDVIRSFLGPHMDDPRFGLFSND
jgi:hypothetical protein